MTKIPLHLTRGQTKDLTAAQRLKIVFDNSKWYYTYNSNDLIFTITYKMMREKIWFYFSTNQKKYKFMIERIIGELVLTDKM